MLCAYTNGVTMIDIYQASDCEDEFATPPVWPGLRSRRRMSDGIWSYFALEESSGGLFGGLLGKMNTEMISYLDTVPAVGEES